MSLMETNNQTTDKQKHFLKRVADMEKQLKDFGDKLNELNRKYEILIKSLRR